MSPFVEFVNVVALIAVLLSGVASTSFLLLYWRIHRNTWLRTDSAWLYIVTLNVTIAIVSAASLGIFLWPHSEAFLVVRTGALIAFAGTIAYQVYMLYQKS